MGINNPPSSVLFGPNNIANDLQNGLITSNGQLIQSNGPKNYITNPGLELGSTTGFLNLGTNANVTTLTPGLAWAPNQYIFTISSASATVGATYQDSSSHIFTVLATVSSSTTLVCSGTNAPTGSSIIKVSGTGDTPIVFSSVISTTNTNNPTLSIINSSQLAGNYSMQSSFVSGGVGQAIFTSAFTIDPEDQAKVLTGKFYYSVVSGGSGANFSGTSSNTLAIWIYDVTNGAWIQPAGTYNLVQSVGVGYSTFTFQTPSNGSQFQLAIYYQNTDSSTLVMNFDDFYLGPQTAPMAPAMSDWTAFTPTGTWVSNTTYTGWWKREGDQLSMTVKVALTGAPTSGALFVNFPTGLVVDTTKLPATPADQMFASGMFGSGAAHNFTGAVIYGTTTSVAPVYYLDGSTTSTQSAAAITPTTPYTLANGDFVYFQVTGIPIVGWSSNSVSSADTDTRVIATRATGSSTALTSSPATVVFPTVTYDLSGSYNASTGIFTVPVTGKYKVSVYLQTNSVVQTSTGAFVVSLFKNGSSYSQISADANKGTGNSASVFWICPGASDEVSCNAGDTLNLSATSSASVSLNSAVGYVTFERLSGPAVVQATESVNGTYTDTAGSAIGTSLATYTFATKVKDSHNAYASGTLTIPVSGQYRFSAVIRTAPITLVTTGNVQIAVLKNGSTFIADGLVIGSGGAGDVYMPNCSNSYPCIAGDTIVVQISSPSGATTASTTAGVNWFSWERVGN